MYFDKKALKEKVEQLGEDVESCELKTSAWLWIIGGGLIGLASSCLKLKRKSGKPIIGSYHKNENTEETNEFID